MIKLNDFVGKVVVEVRSGKRYTLSVITAPYISVKTMLPNSSGYLEFYRFECINGDPFSRGVLKFEDSTLTGPFNKTYQQHCNSEDGYYEDYGYWLRK